MKKKIMLLTVFLLFSFVGAVYGADVTVTVDGKELTQKGVIVDGRTMVPIRDIAEAMGVDVEYTERQRVNLYINNQEFASMRDIQYMRKKVVVENGEIVVNGSWEFFDSDVPMQNINGKSMMPLKVAAEMLNAEISWDGTNYIASVTQKPKTTVAADGTIDLMSGLNKHDRGEYGKPMSEVGFEVTSLVAYWDKNANAWRVDCEYKNATDKTMAAALYIVVFDKGTGKLVESSNRLYNDSWQPGEGRLRSVVFRKYDPQLHNIDVIAR